MASLLATSGLLLALADPAQTLADRPPPSPTPIYGGEIVAPDAWPEVVAIELGGLNCTGTLIAPTLVLTAAHCFADAPAPHNVRVIIGDQSMDPKWVSAASSWEIHPDYCETCKTDIHDYGYIVLLEPAPAAPVRVLSTQDEWDENMQVGGEVLLIGYGEDEKGLSSIKRQATTTIRKFSDSSLEFLAGGDGVDSCQGDSGGPAYVTTSGGQVRLAGVLSRGYACGEGGFYGNAYDVLCWVSEASGVDVTPGKCSTCDCIDYDGGCSRCRTQPRGGDALILAVPLGLAWFGRRRRRR